MKIKAHTRKIGGKTIKVKGHHRRGKSRKKNYGKRVKRSVGKKIKSIRNKLHRLIRRRK